MDYRLIQSDSNPKFKRWRKLAENARFIKKEKATLAEGAHLLLTMAERGITPAALLLRSGGISDEVGNIVENYAREGVPCYVLDNRLYDMISPVEHGSGIMAEVAIVERALPVAQKTDVLYLDGVRRFALAWELTLQRLSMKMLNRRSLPMRLMPNV